MGSAGSEFALRNTEELVDQIRAEFPDLNFSRARLIQGGEDHTVLLLDETWIFRFPRTPEYRQLFAQEVRLLGELRGRTCISVPHYAYVSQDRDFGGYRIIEGSELGPDRLEELSKAAQVHIAEQLGQFLSALHGLPPRLISSGRRAPFSDYGQRYRESRRSLIVDIAGPDLMRAIDDFYEAYVGMQSPLDTVVHEDLRDVHILVAPSLDRLAGVIDFGDAAIGDAALDFSYLWAYGARFFDIVLAHYRLETDARFVARSARHFARFLVEEVHYFARAGRQPEASATCALLRRQLSSLGR